MRMKYWRPTPTPTRIKLIPCEGGEKFFTYFQSWIKANGRARTVICNDHNGELPVPCLVSHYAVEESNPNLLPSRKEVITVLVLEEFYKIPKVSKKGNDYFVYERSLGVDKYGRDLDPEEYKNYEKVFGQKYHWSLGYGHKKQLLEQLEEVGERCGSCREGEISIWGYGCPNCEQILANHKEQEINESVLRELRTATDYKCTNCGDAITPALLKECLKKEGFGSSTKWGDGCDAPELVDPWSCELIMSTTGTGSSTSVVVNDWAAEDTSREFEEWMTAPFSFQEFFQFMDLEEQARLMGRDNPFSNGAQEKLESYFNEQGAKVETYVEPY
jgi:hypothetical protein